MKLVVNGRFLTQPVTGVQRYARELMATLDQLLDRGELDRSRLEVELLSPRLRGGAPPWRHVSHREVGRLSGHAWEQLELPRAAHGDVLFCPGNTAPLAALAGAMRTVVTVHDLSYLYFPDAYSLAFRAAYRTLVPAVLRHADAVVTVSESERRAIVERYPFTGGRLVAIQNGGLPAAARPFDGPPPPRTHALYVGALSKRKNFPGVLAAAVRLNRERALPFVFVGGGGSTFQPVVADVPPDVRGRLTFAGQVDRLDECVRFYRSALCLVFPSFYEASPLPPVEAMACGCPVIASRIPSLLERCGDAALYCDPHDVGDIARAVARLADDAALRQSLVEKGYERARRFSWEACARRTLEVIESVASGRAQR